LIPAKLRGKRTIENAIFLLPACLLILLFKYIGLFYSLYISFTKYTGLGQAKWIGLSNYKVVFDYDIWWLSLRNVGEYVLLFLPIVIVLGFILALILNKDIKGKNLFRTIHFAPMAMSLVAMAFIFKMLMGKAFGPIPQLLRLLHLPVIDLLNDPKWAMKGVVLMMIWQGVGFRMIIFLAGLQSINSEFYDAARIDGATAMQEIRYITIPMLRPTILLLTITGLIGAMQLFDPVLVLPPEAAQPGAPGNALQVPVLVIYNNAFAYAKFGLACALSFVLFLIMLVFTMLQAKVGRLESGIE